MMQMVKSEAVVCKVSVLCFVNVYPAGMNLGALREALYIQVLIKASCIFVQMLVAKIT